MTLLERAGLAVTEAGDGVQSRGLCRGHDIGDFAGIGAFVPGAVIGLGREIVCLARRQSREGGVGGGAHHVGRGIAEARGAGIDLITGNVRGDAWIPGQRDALIGTNGKLGEQHQRTAQKQTASKRLCPTIGISKLHATLNATGLPTDLVAWKFSSKKVLKFFRGPYLLGNNKGAPKLLTRTAK